MSDDLRDKFGSDEDFEDFQNAYNDYTNKTGIFGEQYLKEIVELQKLMYQSFVIENKNCIRMPQGIIRQKNLPMYMFYFRNKKLIDYDETTTMIFN